VEETVGGADKGRVVCKTCGLDRRKGETLPDSGKGKTTAGSGKGKTKTKPAKATAPTQKVEEPNVKATPPVQKVEELDLTAMVLEQKVPAPDSPATPLNEKVKGLESAVDGVVAMLTADFAFTTQDEAKIASVADKLRDALGRGRERRRKRL
jgi:hypothetical protein